MIVYATSYKQEAANKRANHKNFLYLYIQRLYIKKNFIFFHFNFKKKMNTFIITRQQERDLEKTLAIRNFIILPTDVEQIIKDYSSEVEEAIILLRLHYNTLQRWYWVRQWIPKNKPYKLEVAACKKFMELFGATDLFITDSVVPYKRQLEQRIDIVNKNMHDPTFFNMHGIHLNILLHTMRAPALLDIPIPEDD